MLTDTEALTLIERVRRHTPSMDVVELCDWALARLIQSRGGTPVPSTLAAGSVATSAPASPRGEPLTDRKSYMRDYMRKKRKERRDAGS